MMGLAHASAKFLILGLDLRRSGLTEKGIQLPTRRSGDVLSVIVPGDAGTRGDALLGRVQSNSIDYSLLTGVLESGELVFDHRGQLVEYLDGVQPILITGSFDYEIRDRASVTPKQM